MLGTFRLPDKLRHSLVKSGITGEIGSHGAKTNLDALTRLLKLDPYVTFGINAVSTAVKQKTVDKDQAISMMSDALGIPVERFRQPGPGYIDPQLTGAKLSQMLDLVDETARKGGLFVLATSHPGSLLTYYAKLAQYITSLGGEVFRTARPFQVGEYRWIDYVAGVHVLSDEGNLLHTHDNVIFAQFLKHMPSAPDLVLADHGYAGAAINAGVKTVAIHDVDDPGIPLAAHLGEDVLTVPMNDNQLNLPTLIALEAIMDSRKSA